ncbi:hypothetical protein [Nocardia salmonicida]|uniref:hypothetical protein n=1 Tax=Nocardia salmonicida TaxID=53431 RepID=UPI0036432140
MNAVDHAESTGGRRLFTLPYEVHSSAHFMSMMREMPHRAALTGGQIASFGKLPRSTVYRFLHKDNNTLPKSRQQVEKFATACRLTPSEVHVVLAFWERLSAAEATVATPPRLIAIDGKSIAIDEDGVSDGTPIAIDADGVTETPIIRARVGEEVTEDEPEAEDRQSRSRRRGRDRSDAYSPLVRRVVRGGTGNRDVFRSARRTMFPLVLAVVLLIGQLHSADWLPQLDSLPRYSLWMVIVLLAVPALKHGIDGFSRDRTASGWVSRIRVPLAVALSGWASFAVCVGTKDFILASGFSLLVFAATPSLVSVWSNFSKSTMSKSTSPRMELMQYGAIASTGIGITTASLVYSIGVPVPIAVLAGCVIGAMMTISISEALHRPR